MLGMVKLEKAKDARCAVLMRGAVLGIKHAAKAARRLNIVAGCSARGRIPVVLPLEPIPGDCVYRHLPRPGPCGTHDEGTHD